MWRRRAAGGGLGGAWAALSLLPLAACGRGPELPYRHVVVISLDTFRADHLGSYGGHVPTPHLDGLAAAGLRCAQAHGPAPTTLASHTSMFTGLHPHVHGVPRNGFVVDEANVTLAEILRPVGFHCAGFLGSFALESRFGLNQGFDHWDEQFSILLDGRVFDQNQRRANEVTDAVLRHLDRIGEQRHLFLFAHYFDAHSPYDPPPEFAPRGPDGPLPGSTQDEIGAAVAEHHRALFGAAPSLQDLFRAGLSREVLAAPHGEPRGVDRRLADQYAGEVAFLDQQIGRLLSGLEARGILRDAIVVVTGDHGETFWEHADLWNHGLWVYDTTQRVPLILRLPDGRGAGRVLEQPVSTIDLLPTLCELLGLEYPGEVEGQSLVPALDGGAPAPRPVFMEATQPTHPEVERGAWPNARKARAVRDGPWKYVHAPYNGWEELFHVERDPGERQNLLLGTPAPAVRLERDRLRAILDRWSQSARPRRVRFDAGQSREVLERLRSLGYVDDAPLGHDH